MPEQKETVFSREMRDSLSQLYGTAETEIEKQVRRFKKILDTYTRLFGTDRVSFYSAPGRTELGGNHTDHNHGKVLAASVNLDAVAAAGEFPENKIVLFSDGYPEAFVVDLARLDPITAERGTTSALIRGIAARFVETGHKIGGFRAVVSSDVLPGSGLSSSAAIEVLIGTILNEMYNSGEIPPEKIAAMGQFAENVFFGKPCGLMDQTASAVGGIVAIDFQNPEEPEVTRLHFDLDGFGYSLLLVNTGSSHADLTIDYATIPEEMKAVARFFGKAFLRDVSEAEVFSQAEILRKRVGDRALLRAFHFFAENDRVTRQIQALDSGDFGKFLRLVTESGNSSWKWLQNVTPSGNPGEQSLALALALSEDFIQKRGEGACRVHGGGFAGTILTFLPQKWVPDYTARMESVFGENSVLNVSIRPTGATRVF
ncbi:MAG: galactokinase [Calditrichaeota bacterium]|nr:galactokinase [Calditrichota bacterium]